MHIRRKYSQPYLVNKSSRLLATASARQGFFSVLPVTLVSATACLIQDLDLPSTPPKYLISNFSTTTHRLRHRCTLLMSVLPRQFSLHQLFRQSFVSCPHASCAHLSCWSISRTYDVRQPNETVLKVDEEGRVRRWVTCSYASCFWKHREEEAPS